ncbi:hypothetical protein Pint_07932 [Pistacia integerrima]|uniref:Uncharacterized protein n=1 Tax=Pistacia integerrima TaxID=434235 RepID=A0ACC0XXA6_9ROSI|nr:hypothetical protein Pint_07932 [Pistacia integerrima]
MVPFGGGPHACPGKEHAKLQILVFMHNLERKIRWEKLIPDAPLIRDSILGFCPSQRASDSPLSHPHRLLLS